MKHDLNLKMIKSNFDHFVNMALSSYRKSTSKSFTRSNDIIYLNDDYFIISANTADELSEKPIISTKNNKFHLFYNDDKILENLSIKHKIKIMSVMLSLLKFTPLYCNIELNNYFVYECNEL